MRINFVVLLFTITGVLLLLCLCDMPYGYYTFVRSLTAIVCVFLAINFKSIGIGISYYLYLIIAAVFQPIFKIPFGKTLWQIFDVLLALNFLKIAWNNATVKGFVPRYREYSDIDVMNSPIRGMYLAELLTEECPIADRYIMGNGGLGHFIVLCNGGRMKCSIHYINIAKKIIVEISVDNIIKEKKEINVRDRSDEAVVADILAMKSFKEPLNT